MGQDFETGLCECFSDCETCLCAFCLPCVQFGRNAHPLLPCSGCLTCGIFFWLSGGFTNHCILLQNRILIRNEYGYDRSDGCDCFKVMFCTPCVLAQEGRVLKAKK
ncbi:Hypothetical protein ACA1_067420 [Acanthamoeba castellanii str. Neff]|uniref:PLAC8 family protein n=1 Tax=Acanthamoeba castellanii (strain ATCC 30010 / Neff) TaxID=1257118 RepID=L8GRD7_ACACF|nr:Hypothetical protein ACA1_067420 [Acanthamoeba castellanii str. Neff]ELR15497.1 Hypothetical protein ACA1_067420 [Acanthamoeba castellanii str. Neff]